MEFNMFIVVRLLLDQVINVESNGCVLATTELSRLSRNDCDNHKATLLVRGFFRPTALQFSVAS